MICGRRFSFITIASIDFWSDLQLIFLHFIACILPSIIRHTVVYAVWYGVWSLMVWPWFGHSSMNHNEHAVSSAVSRMKMPPVLEHASSLVRQSPYLTQTTSWPIQSNVMCQADFDLVLPLTYGFHIVLYFVCVFFVLYWYCSDLFVESGDFESIWNCYCTCFCYKTLNKIFKKN